MEQYRKRKILLGEDGNALMALIAVNAILFVFLIFVKIRSCQKAIFEVSFCQIYSPLDQPKGLWRGYFF